MVRIPLASAPACMDGATMEWKTKSRETLIDLRQEGVNVLCQSELRTDSWTADSELTLKTPQDLVSIKEDDQGGSYWIPATSERVKRVERITYEVGPTKVGNIPNWKRCQHVRAGRDLRSLNYAGALGSIRVNRPFLCGIINTRLTYNSPQEVEVEAHAVLHAKLAFADRHQLLGGLILSDSTPDYSKGDEFVTYEELLTRYGNAEDSEGYRAFLQSLDRKMEESVDLNNELHEQSYIYSNLLQTACPIGRLLSRRGVFQRAVNYLSRMRSKFGKRPFLEALTELGKADLFYRFAIQTTVSDIRSFMNSFDDVLRAFELTAERNALPWLRLSAQDTFEVSSNTSQDIPLDLYCPDFETFSKAGALGWTIDLPDGNSISSAVGGNPAHMYAAAISPGRPDGNYFCFGGDWDVYPPGDRRLLKLRRKLQETNACFKLSSGLHLTERHQRWAKVRYGTLGSISPLKTWLNRVGITKPLSSLWDGLPFTFVLDYFLRVGDFIEGVENFFTDTPYLKGQVIDVGPVWRWRRYSIGPNVRASLGLPMAEIAAAIGVDQQDLSITQPDNSALSKAYYFSRSPVNSPEEIFQLRDIVQDDDLNPTRKRTLVELALNLQDKAFSRREADVSEMRSALTAMKLSSRGWRRNATLDNWSSDQFSEYLKRTVRQAQNTFKKR